MNHHTEPFDADLEDVRSDVSWFRLDMNARAYSNPTGLFSGNRFTLPKSERRRWPQLWTLRASRKFCGRVPVDLTYVAPKRTKSAAGREKIHERLKRSGRGLYGRIKAH